jgi:5-(carboxyamino)imidazole ribonucleotide synthase
MRAKAAQRPAAPPKAAPRGPAAQVCDLHIKAAVDDPSAALELARASDVVTLEWELIPAGILKKIEAVKPLYPSSLVLAVIQDRLGQKEFLKKNGFPQTDYHNVNDLASLQKAVKAAG